MQQYCLRPVLTFFEGKDVKSTVHISVPLDMNDLMRRFKSGDLTKVISFLGYSYDNCCLSLRADGINIISRVKVVVN